MSKKGKKLPTDVELSHAKTWKDLPLVRVYWGDANGWKSWRSFKEARENAKLVPIMSVGHLLKKTKDLILLAPVITDDSDSAKGINLESIPMANVTRISVIEPAQNS